MKRRDFLQSIPTSAIGLGAVPQLETTDAFGKEAASVSSAPIHSDESFWPDGAAPRRLYFHAEFIDYAQKHKGVWFARKDEIARWTLESANTILAK